MKTTLKEEVFEFELGNGTISAWIDYEKETFDLGAVEEITPNELAELCHFLLNRLDEVNNPDKDQFPITKTEGIKNIADEFSPEGRFKNEPRKEWVGEEYSVVTDEEIYELVCNWREKPTWPSVASREAYKRGRITLTQLINEYTQFPIISREDIIRKLIEIRNSK